MDNTKKDELINDIIYSLYRVNTNCSYAKSEINYYFDNHHSSTGLHRRYIDYISTVHVAYIAIRSERDRSYASDTDFNIDVLNVCINMAVKSIRGLIETWVFKSEIKEKLDNMYNIDFIHDYYVFMNSVIAAQLETIISADI